jgi:hypothetical protein
MADTTVSTLTAAIPTIVGAALLELEEGDIIAPLITQIDFPGPGVVHNTPFIKKLTAESTDDLTAQALQSASDEDLSAATCGVHAAWVHLKDIASLGAVGDMAAVAGQLIGQSLVTLRENDLKALFVSLTTNQGGVGSGAMAPADLYDAYGSLRTGFAPLPYNLVLNPGQIWNSSGLIAMFDNSADAIQNGGGVGSVAEDFARYGFAGMAMGFTLWADANVNYANTASASGAAFSRAAFKQVYKRRFMIEIDRQIEDVAQRIVGSEIRGEAVLRNKHGNEMQFPIGKA